MSLLADIQAACTEPQSDVARLLRLCLQLAARLKHQPLKQWVQHELNGYPDGIELPEYRVHGTRSRGYFADRFAQATLDIPMSVLKEPLKSRFSEARLTQPIKQYESLLEGGDGDMQLPWPQELAFHVGPKVSPVQCIRVWQELPRAAIAGTIDSVKTRVLSMVLDIEDENPAAGEIQGAGRQISEERVSQIFNTNIYGGQVQNLAAGSPGAVQTATNTVVAGDIASLKSYLADRGIEPSEIADLEVAVREDQATGQKGIGARVGGWLSRLPQRMRAGTTEVSKQAIIGVATQALLAYFGVGS